MLPSPFTPGLETGQLSLPGSALHRLREREPFLIDCSLGWEVGTPSREGLWEEARASPHCLPVDLADCQQRVRL